jgi:hypothetical protein
MIDFEQIPDWWALCGNSQCEHAGECLRHLAFTQAPQKVTRWTCVLPTAMENGRCRYFQKAEKVQMARGFKRLFTNIKNKYARHEIRIKLTEYFGSKGSYYRYRDGKRWLNPELQQMIADLMQEQGLKEQPVFDECYETYDFTKHSA